MARKRSKKRRRAATKGRYKQQTLQFAPQDNASAWYDGITTAEQITPEILTTLFHLDQKPCTRDAHKNRKNNCKANPACIFGLGEGKEGLWTKEPAVFSTLGDDPRRFKREPGQNVGLANLGATCYMNALLQCLYMNTAFRQGVYEWVNDEPKIEESVCCQLQLLFGQLQLSECRKFSPTAITRLLDIKTSIQQDAQEFNKLFVAYLEERFSRSPIENVRRLIQTQFCGRYEYRTECSTCHRVSRQPSSFYELELNIPSSAPAAASASGSSPAAIRLEDCLAAFTREEHLTEAAGNQYLCPHCGGLRDATRRITFEHLFGRSSIQNSPSTDTHTPPPSPSRRSERDKAKSAKLSTASTPALPEVLNLQLLRFVYDARAGTRRKVRTAVAFPLAIDLAAVLSPMSTATADGTAAQSDSPAAANEPILYDLAAVLFHIGTTAYGGHYVAVAKDDRTGRWFRFDDENVTEITVDEISDSAKGAAAAAAADGVDEDDGFQTAKRKRRGKSNASTADTKEAARPKSPLTTYITSGNAYMLVYAKRGRHVVDTPTPPSWVLDAVARDNAAFRERCEQFAERYAAAEQRVVGHRGTYDSVIGDMVVSGEGGNAADCYWVPTEWLVRWVRGEVSEDDRVSLSTSLRSVLCEHGRLPPTRVDDMKRIAPVGWTYLHDNHGGADDDMVLHGMDALCVDCSLKRCMQLADDRKMRAERARVLAGCQGNEPRAEEAYWASKEWLREFMKSGPRDDVELGDHINAAITCRHGQLSVDTSLRRLITVEAWSYLRSLFPEGPEFHGTTPACAECERDIQTRKEEKTALADVYRARHELPTPPAEGRGGSANGNGEEYFLLATRWHDAWRSYVDDVDIAEPPNVVDNSPLVCRHGKLLYDPAVYSQNASTKRAFVFLRAAAWHQLMEKYGQREHHGDISVAGPVIGVRLKPGKRPAPPTVIAVEPPVCAECRRQREETERQEQLNYQDREIRVVKRKFPGSGGRGSRGGRGGSSATVTVGSNLTLHVLKLMILERLDIVPMQQRLWVMSDSGDEGRLLEGDDLTLGEAGVTPDMEIYVEQLEGKEAADAEELLMAGFAEEAAAARNGAELGFKGTKLTSAARTAAESSESDSDEEDSVEGERMLSHAANSSANAPSPMEQEAADGCTKPWRCKLCTFDNDPAMVVCEQCETPRP